MTTSSISPLNMSSYVSIAVPLGKEGISDSAIDVWLSWREMKMVQRSRKNDTHHCELFTGSGYTWGPLPVYWPIYRLLRVSYPPSARLLHRVIRPFRMLEYRSGLCCRVPGLWE